MLAKRFRSFNFSNAGTESPGEHSRPGIGVHRGRRGHGHRRHQQAGAVLRVQLVRLPGHVRLLPGVLRHLPRGRSPALRAVVFFLPSLLFWTAGISKETMMYLSLGLMAYGAARVLAHLRGGAVLLVVGAIIGVYVRPQELLLFMAAFAVAGLVPSPEHESEPSEASGGSSVMALQARPAPGRDLTVAATGQTRPGVQPQPAGQEQHRSEEQPALPPRPGGLSQGHLRRCCSTPCRSTPTASTQRLAAFENTVIIVLFLTSFRRFWHLARACFTRPYVLLCVMYSVAFPYAFAALEQPGPHRPGAGAAVALLPRPAVLSR